MEKLAPPPTFPGNEKQDYILSFHLSDNEKFLSPSEARRRKKFRIHLSCVCVYPFLQGEDPSFVQKKVILSVAKTALTIFFKLCIPPFLGLKNFVLGFSSF